MSKSIIYALLYLPSPVVPTKLHFSRYKILIERKHKYCRKEKLKLIIEKLLCVRNVADMMAVASWPFIARACDALLESPWEREIKLVTANSSIGRRYVSMTVLLLVVS